MFSILHSSLKIGVDFILPKFGPAGNSDSFYSQGYKHSVQMPQWLFNLGLDAYEYQCGKGIHISPTTAIAFGEKAAEYGISLSLHAPYFISLSSADEETRLKSIQYILDSARVANDMGAKRITIHSGSCSKMSRETALELAKDTLKMAIARLDDEGFSHITLCPETMGKLNQLGTLQEVVELCKVDERLLPTLDFGHLNARSMGALKTYSDFEKIFDTVENNLGIDRLRVFHSHFSRIEYTEGGEKRHLTFEDTVYGPDFEHIAELTVKKNCAPTFICESKGTMAEDALTMKNIYLGLKGE